MRHSSRIHAAWAIAAVPACGSPPEFSVLDGGGRHDSIRDVAVDSVGFIYVVGRWEFDPAPGPDETPGDGNVDVHITKLTPTGEVVWRRYLGGPNHDRAYAVEIGPDDTVYVAGRAGEGFPTTPGVLQESFGGDDFGLGGPYGRQDGFVAKYTRDGALLWATYFGSDDGSIIRDLDVDDLGCAYVGAIGVRRQSPHATPGSFQPILTNTSDESSVIAKLSPDGSRVEWATHMSAPGGISLAVSVRVTSTGEVVAGGLASSTALPTTPGAFDPTHNGGGTDYYLFKLAPDGDHLLFGTYFGGSGEEDSETHLIALDPDDNIVFATTTQSPDIPTTPGAVQAAFAGAGQTGTGLFTNYHGDLAIAKLSSDGRDLLASTYLGGRFGDGAEGLSIDAEGNILFSGASYSDDFPTTTGSAQPALAGDADWILGVLSPDMTSLRFATHLGGSRLDHAGAIEPYPGGRLVVGGSVESPDWVSIPPGDTPATSSQLGVALIDYASGSCPVDADGNGLISLEDLYFQHQHPADLNGDGAIDAADNACLEAFLRRNEAFDLHHP